MLCNIASAHSQPQNCVPGFGITILFEKYVKRRHGTDWTCAADDHHFMPRAQCYYEQETLQLSDVSHLSEPMLPDWLFI